MTHKSRWLIPYFAAALALVLRLWMSLLRLRIVAADGQSHPADPRVKQYIYAFWHEALLAPLATRAKVRVLISQHTDGELIAQICQRLGIGTIRASASRDGCKSLLAMIRDRDDSSHLGITPDGPRGPRRELKPGVVVVASQTGLAIVPAGIGFTRAWRFGSWDRFALPCPGSTIVGVLGEPIVVPAGLDREALRHWVLVVEAEMNRLTFQAEDWADRIRAHGPQVAPPSEVTSAKPRQAA